jgi:hypothetical protein
VVIALERKAIVPYTPASARICLDPIPRDLYKIANCGRNKKGGWLAHFDSTIFIVSNLVLQKNRIHQAQKHTWMTFTPVRLVMVCTAIDLSTSISIQSSHHQQSIDKNSHKSPMSEQPPNLLVASNLPLNFKFNLHLHSSKLLC